MRRPRLPVAPPARCKHARFNELSRRVSLPLSLQCTLSLSKDYADGSVAVKFGGSHLPAPVFAEAVVGEDPAAAGRCAEHPTMIIDLPRGQRVSSGWRLRARSDRQHFGPFGAQLFRLW